MSLNKTIIMGRLVRDPELRATQNGVSVCTFTLAVDRDVKNSDGTRSADFIDCVAWRGTAEFIAENFYKGKAACVDGRLQMRKYETADGDKRTAWEVLVSSIYFADSREKPADTDRASPPRIEPGFTELESDGELPF